MSSGEIAIPYRAEGFPAGTIQDAVGVLATDWDDLLWAALTVGRPSLHAVLQYGESSWFEAVFRLSMIWMALEQRASGGSRLYRTEALNRLDPTEKGMNHYLLGMVLCKLLAARLLDAPLASRRVRPEAPSKAAG